MNDKLIGQILRILMITLMTCGISSNVMAEDYPEEAVLDSIAELYDEVVFDHVLHTEIGEDCSVCHHHTTGTGTEDERCVSCHGGSDETASVACRDCHVAEPFSAVQINREAENLYQYHVDKPGLKAAYHWNCIGCHEEMDGPTGCQDCHSRTSAGDDFFHAEVVPSASHAAH